MNQVSFLPMKVFPSAVCSVVPFGGPDPHGQVGCRAGATHYSVISVIADNLPSLVWAPVIHSES